MPDSILQYCRVSLATAVMWTRIWLTRTTWHTTTYKDIQGFTAQPKHYTDNLTYSSKNSAKSIQQE